MITFEIILTSDRTDELSSANVDNTGTDELSSANVDNTGTDELSSANVAAALLFPDQMKYINKLLVFSLKCL